MVEQEAKRIVISSKRWNRRITLTGIELRLEAVNDGGIGVHVAP